VRDPNQPAPRQLRPYLIMDADSEIWLEALARSVAVFRLWQCRSRRSTYAVLASEEGGPPFGHKGTLLYLNNVGAFFPYGTISSCVVGKPRFPAIQLAVSRCIIYGDAGLGLREKEETQSQAASSDLQGIKQRLCVPTHPR
jgi:hypothetical protein